MIASDPDAASVLISPDLDLAALLGEGRLAMALVDAVPAGQYGRAALEGLGLWDGVAAQVAQAENVRAALALVASGAAPLGIVYETDAAEEPRVTMLGAFPEDSHPPIRYPAALVLDAAPEAAAFLDFLSGAEAQAVFMAAGFTIPDAVLPGAGTPDELGDAWRGSVIHLPLMVDYNGQPFGRANAGVDATFSLAELVAHAAKTRDLGAGTIIGSGTVSNQGPDGDPGKPVAEGGLGYSCIAEIRMIETIANGEAQTRFMEPGDTVRVEMKDKDGHSIFGAIEQKVVEA